MKQKLFKNRHEWRAWLEKNHDKESEIWLVFYKVKVKKKSIKYEEAVEEALCFGWIDSIVKRIDDEKHMQKYTPRKVNSNWSASNKTRVQKLLKEGKITRPGLDAIEIAKQNGSWNRLDAVEVRLETPKELVAALKNNHKAKKAFENLTSSRKKQFLWWIASAKRDETKSKRVKETLRLLIGNKNPGA